MVIAGDDEVVVEDPCDAAICGATSRVAFKEGGEAEAEAEAETDGLEAAIAFEVNGGEVATLDEGKECGVGAAGAATAATGTGAGVVEDC